MLQDLRYGFRFLARNRGFAAVAIGTLALSIGANTAIFSLVSAVLLRPLPYPNPEQLVGLGQWREQKGEGYVQTGVSAPNIVDIEKSGVFSYVAYYRWAGFNITGGNRPESIDGIQASAELLPMFGVRPLMGRVLRPEETEAGHDQEAVIGFKLWQTRFGSDPAILGKAIELNQRRYTIVGVMPASFRFTWDQEMDVFVPLVLTAEERSEAGRGDSRDLQTQARLKNGVTLTEAQAAMNTLARTLARDHPAADAGWGIKVEALHAAYHRNMRKPLLIILAAVLLVLLIACVNVSNLLLARATARKREMAIRAAIGAGRRRLLGQLLTESLLLSLCAGGLGLLLAWGEDQLLTLGMARYGFALPNAKVIDLDWRVLAFTLAATIVTGFIFGLAPAWVTSRAAVNESLKEGSLSTTGDSGGRRMREMLVVCEIALALVLLTGAGLMVRTFLALMKVDLGINPRNVLTMGINLPSYKYSSGVLQETFFRDVLARMEAVPGVKSAGAESGGANVFFQPEGAPPAAPGQEPTARYNIITPDFLKAMGTKLVSGRPFRDGDNASGAAVALVSETVSKRYWPQTNPLGQHVTILEHEYSGARTAGRGRLLEIVGVVQDMRNENLWSPQPAIYVPFAQNPMSGAFVAVRTAVAPMSVAPELRAAVQAIDPDQPLNRLRAEEEIIAQTYGSIRFPMTLLWLFSALALLLSAIGIFGVMSYMVTRRTREMAIRLALGAGGGDVLRLVMREGLTVSAAGVTLGLAGAVLFSRVMAGYMYGITATDPLTFIVASLVLIAVALAASWIPAKRASRVDPLVALRWE